MKAKRTNNYPASDDVQVNPATETQWLVQPLPRHKMVKKADAIENLINHTKRMILKEDEC